MPRGGIQTSLVGLINALSAPFRRQTSGQPRRDPSGGRGAPVMSYSWGQNAGGFNTGNNLDMTRFAPVFQPSGGLFAPSYRVVPVDNERTRRWNFPVGYNLTYTPRSFEPVGFAELRALAQHDITRLAIETRKDQIEKLQWTIKPRDEKNAKRGAAKRIDKLIDFWSLPDGIRPFATWLRELVEEVLVIDAPALEPRFNRVGDLIGLDVIDGATIKVLIDDTGRVPRPPAPAFEQVIHGRPWVLLEDGRRSNTEEGEVVDRFTSQELIYFPRNQRVSHAYGLSPVEQIMLTVNTGIRRAVMQLQHFTIGNVPPGLLNAPEGWTPEQVAQFQDWFDSKLQGNTGEKTKLVWGPYGAKFQPIQEPPLKDEFDEWLARVVCFAFSLPPTAFTKTQNRGEQEATKEAALEEGLAPLMGWIKRLVDSVIQRRQGHPDLEFTWSDVRTIDANDQSAIVDQKLRTGRLTLNAARDLDGQDPVEGGDTVLIYLPSGPVTLDSILNPPEPPPIPGFPGQNGQNPPVEQG